MHRIDFFGAAVFVPVFLVSAGFPQSSVMVEGETRRLLRSSRRRARG